MSATTQEEIQVLHVDDEPAFTDLTQTVLERENTRFTVETVTSADQGLEFVTDRPPDCVVSDYNMPGMDGLEFLQAVREKYPDLPFILYTGKGSEAVASEAIAADVTDYLQKESGTEQYELLANRILNAVQARHEAKRADRQEQLMRLTEFAGDTGGFELDRGSDTFLLTAGARRIIDRPDLFETSLEEAIELFHPDDREGIQQTFDRAFETGEELHDRWRLQPGDGDERLLDITITPVVENGEVTKLRGSGNDITDRKERRQELEQIETLFQHAQDSLFLIDVAEELIVERVNTAWEDATGLSAEQVRGQTPRNVLGEQPGAAAESKYNECIQRQKPLQYEETVRFDGEITHWVTHIAPVVVDGTVEYIAGSTRDITEENERRKNLEQARDLMANMEQLVDAGAWEYDSESERLMITDGTRRLYGLDPEADLTLEAALDAIHPDDRDPLADRLNNCLETGEPYEVDVRLTTSDGTQRWVTASGERVSESEAGSVVRGYIRDITEQQAYERDLKRYRTVFNELPDPVVVYDEKNQYDLVNDAAAEIRGVPREELIGTKSPYLEQIQEEHPAEYDALIKGARDTLRAELTDEFTGRGKRTLACDLTLVTAGSGLSGTAIVTRDVTDRKERRQELEEYETIIEALTDAVYVLDEEGRFTYVNDEFVELVGYDRETILGSMPSLIKDESAVEQAEQELGRLLSSDGPETVSFEVTVHPRDGDPVVCEDHMGVLPYEGDQFNGSVGTLRDITARKERERQLSRERKRYTTLFETLPNPVLHARAEDGEPVVETVNPVFEDTFGYDAETVRDEPVQDYILPDDQADAAHQLNRQVLTEGDAQTEVQRETTEGVRTFRLNITTRNTESGNLEGYTVYTDITDRKQTERALEQERDLVTGIVETVPVGLSVVDADGSISFVNEQMESIGGWSLEDIEGNPHDDSRYDLVDKYGEPLGSGETPFDRVVSRETAIHNQVVGTRRQSGERVWLSVSGAPQYNDDGELERTVFAFEDITKQRELEAELSEILGRISDGFFALDEEFRVTHVNGRGEELLRRSEDELLGETLWDMYPETEESDEMWDTLRAAMDTQTTQSREVHSEPRDNWFETTVYPSESGVSVYFRDVTERKENERELKTQNERLGEFASIVSHDLRSPLGVAEGHLELAEATSESEHLTKASDAIERSQALIDDLLTLARGGDGVDETEPVALADVAERSWQTTETGSATLDTDATQAIRADRSRLRQLLVNLYRNAVEHGGEDVTVSVGATDAGFYVADTGPGISESEREDVFEAGYSTTEDGTGFGLRIVTQIAEAHGWDIAVTASEQGGARFEITGVGFADR